MFHGQSVLYHRSAIRQVVVPVAGELGVVESVWSPHDSEGWAERAFELRSPSGCGGLTKEWVNRRSFRSRENNKRKKKLS